MAYTRHLDTAMRAVRLCARGKAGSVCALTRIVMFVPLHPGVLIVLMDTPYVVKSEGAKAMRMSVMTSPIRDMS